MWCKRCLGLLRLNTKDILITRTKTADPKYQYIVRTVRKEKKKKEKAFQFIDYKRIYVRAGNGGNGCVSFLSLYANEFAGPDGGDAGHGGHVIFEADSNTHSLTHLKSQITASNGDNGRNKNQSGKNAEHTYVKVPVGTIFKDDVDFKLLADLGTHGSHYVGARGGGGGRGNGFFVTSTDTAPTVYEEGGKGQERILHVELKVIAHVGLIGFPNAGKSTLLRALSKARPKVAAYPFTTLRPHIGMIQYKDHEQVAVADIPGLIPGAHMDRGLGISFLKHIERCVCLLFVLDLSASDPQDQLASLQYELDQYKAGLSGRPHAIVANKIDLPMAQKNLEELRQNVPKDMTIFPLSAKHKTDIKPLVQHIRELYDSRDDEIT